MPPPIVATWRSLAGAAVLATVFAFNGAAPATEIIPADGEAIVIESSQGTLIRLDEPAAAVFVANPDIADLAVKSPSLIYVFGKRPGTTTLYAVNDAEDVLLNVRLTVLHNISTLNAALGAAVPGGDARAQSVPGGIVLTGAVDNSVQAEDARRLAARFVGEGEDVINRLQITASNQVNLRVRVAEMSRDVERAFGIDWSVAGDTTGIGFSFISNQFPGRNTAFSTIAQGADAMRGEFGLFGLDITNLVTALSEEGLITILAEPNLTSLSGETASFLAGGEFPIPVPQDDNTITIEFKRFGVSLAFTPTVLSDGRISLHVRPEVSQISTENQFVTQGFVVPSLVTRRAETTVELASGQSFAIGGLLQSSSSQSTSKVPGLGDVPILGELFRSERFLRNETELVIMVTPYVVRPVSAKLIATPVDATVGRPGTQRLASGSAEPPIENGLEPPAPERLQGHAGFVIQ